MRTFAFMTATLGFLLISCSKIEEPEFRAIEDFRVIKLGLDRVRIGFGMTYYNPNDFSVSVKETGADIYLDSTFLGRLVQDSTVEVGRRKEFTIQLSGSIPLSTFLRMNLKDIHKREVLIQADGSTKVGKAGIFISRKIGYQGRHRLDRIRF